MAGVTEKLVTQPGTLHTLSGGTRNKIVLNRPWQGDLPYNPEKCPFCTKSESEAMDAGVSGWRVLGNPFTPHSFHLLVIPKKCPTPEETRMLCGPDAIEEALAVYSKVIPVAKVEGFERTVFAVHVGYLAGQNLGHMHWHVCDAKEPAEFVEVDVVDTLGDYKCVVLRSSGFTIYAAGSRAGQLYIVRDYEACSWSFAGLAGAIADVLMICNEKWKSAQGFPPEYVLAVVCDGDDFRYATYVPILNHWGFPQYLAPSGDSEIVLSWPHETTAAYLHGEISA